MLKDSNQTNPPSEKKKKGWKLFSWKRKSSEAAEVPSPNPPVEELNHGPVGLADSMEKMTIEDGECEISSVPLSTVLQPKATTAGVEQEQPKFEPTLKTTAAPLVTPHEAMVCAKRVRKEYEDLREEVHISPLPNLLIAMDPKDHLKWYVLIHSLTEPCFQNGEYLFHVALSPRYPFSPPDFYFFTPNGRFEISRKLCFSNSSYHAEMWSPIWKIKTIIMGFLSFFLDKTSKGLGHIQNVSDEKKRTYAEESKRYNENHHSDILQLIRQQNDIH
jgi:ubiquitin-protein ligase